MKKFKILPFVAIASAFLLGLRSPQKAQSLNTENIVRKVEGPNLARPEVTPEKALVIPDGAVEISDKASFESFMNQANNAKNAYLSADIDLGGAVYGTRMGGEYTGIFEGNDFTISNYSSTQTLFNFVNAGSIIRNINLKLSIAGSHNAGLAFWNKGLIENVNIQLNISDNYMFISGITRVGSDDGTFDNCHVDFIFSGAGKNSTNVYTIAFENNGYTVNDCTYYVEDYSGTINVSTGSTERFTPIFGGGVILPKVEILDYDDVIYVEEEPSSVEITAELKNTEEEAEWSIDSPTGVGTIADVDLADEVATITALAKGTVSFKFKATIDGEDYLSELVSVQVLNSSTEYVIPPSAHVISDAASFKSFFNGAAGNNAKNAVVTADIDLGGYSFDLGQAGDYSAIFEGQGYTIKNYTAKALFNWTTATSEIRNLKVEYIPKVSGFGGVAFGNRGLIKNVKAKVTITAAINTFAGISLDGTGTHVNCHTDFIIKPGAEAANTLYPITQNDNGKTLSNCTWTLINGNNGMISTNNAQVTRDLVREGALGFAIWMMDHEGGDLYTGKAECEAKWDAALLKWAALSTASRAQVRELAEFEDAWLRLQAWAAANGTTPDAEIVGGVNVTPKNSVGVTLIIGLLGLSTIALYYALLKTKRPKESK